jgi:hypothetical protein
LRFTSGAKAAIPFAGADGLLIEIVAPDADR